MLDDPRSRSLSEVFATQWLSLDQVAISKSTQGPCLQKPTLDYMDYLFREDRPLTELVTPVWPSPIPILRVIIPGQSPFRTL